MEHPQWERQLELEEEMRSAGIARFRDQLEEYRNRHQESQGAAARRLMVHAHEGVVEGLKAFFAEASSGKAGAKHTAIKYLAEVDVDVAAHLTLRTLLDTVSLRSKLTPVAIRISSLIEDELYFDTFKDTDEFAYNRARTKITEQSQNPTYRKRVMSKHARNKGVEWAEWPADVRVKVGVKLIEIAVERTGLFELVRNSEGVNNTQLYVVAAPETLEWMSTENARLEPLSPVYLPTLVPPRPWTSPKAGGYWSGRVRHLRLVKTGNMPYLAELENCDMGEVYSAVNAMQETAWTINRKVHDVMVELWDNQSTIASIPQAEDLPLPEKPLWLTPEMKTEDMTPAQVGEFQKWKSSRTSVYEANARAVSKRMQFGRMLWVANRFKDEPEFFFPHQLDFRGRVYAVPLFLHPQGNDAARGLLTFASTVPIGDEEGARWLAIHGAGLWGVDKVGMDARVQWVLDNEEAILASARNPTDNRFWAEAEKPWQALAFCFEWLGFHEQGFAYESHLPVQMDGTCNGLQNFSAMLLDEVGGRAVNLVPGDQPNDIYQTVADVLVKKLEAIAATCLLPLVEREIKDKQTGEWKTVMVESDGSMARKWLARGITRKTTKRPVMTLAYGASQFGFKEQVYDDTVTPWKIEAGDAFPFEGTGFAAAAFLGGLIWECVGEVVVAARGAMDWLQKVAVAASKERLPVVWTTPTGFKVMQEYTTSEQKKLDLTFQKVRLQLRLDTSTRTIDKRRQSSGISPNWVHSMDAAHMQKTVLRSHAEGIRSFSLIHDSYGTHAGNSWALAQYLREEFVRMYTEHDVLAEFREEIAMALPGGTALPELPPKGQLDLSQVLHSPFFFA